MEALQPDSNDEKKELLSSVVSEAKINENDADDFSELLKVSRDAGKFAAQPEENLSDFERALKKIREQEENYCKQIDDFYRALPELPPPTKDASKLFQNPNVFYRTLMSMITSDAGNVAGRLHQELEVFLSDEEDAASKQMGRNKIIIGFWNFFEEILNNLDQKFSDELIYMMRYGMLIPSIVSRETLSIIANIDIHAENSTSVYYVDEWLRAVTSGRMSQSVTNEVLSDRNANTASMKQRVISLKEQERQQLRRCQEIDNEIKSTLLQVRNAIEQLDPLRTETKHDFHVPFTSTDLQRFKSVHENLRLVVNKNTQLEVQYNGFLYNERSVKKLQQELRAMEDMKDGESASINNKIIVEELFSVRQMCKLCVGVRGNHFPILHHSYFGSPLRNMGYRERVIQMLREIETIDFTLFQRVIKGSATRVFPIIVLVPCYGNKGFCWEPFEKYQKNTSSAKIIIPMYPKDIYMAMLYGLGDYRWQIAKETAGQFWMEEGLTGWYFQWFDSAIKKGDIKQQFIDDYVLWMQWEQKGVQKLAKEVREIFWRYIPFNRKLKNELLKMAPSYQELNKKEQNRYMSELI